MAESAAFDGTLAAYHGELVTVESESGENDAEADDRRTGAATTIGAGARGWQQRKRQGEQRAAAQRISAARTHISPTTLVLPWLRPT